MISWRAHGFHAPNLPGLGLAITLIAAGCGLHPWDAEFNKMVEKTKENSKAAEIRAEAMPLFSASFTNAFVRPSELPPRLTALPIFASGSNDIAAYFIGDTRSRSRALVLTTGGPFYWGLVICQFEGSSSTVKSMHGKAIPWEDGVFFWKDR